MSKQIAFALCGGELFRFAGASTFPNIRLFDLRAKQFNDCGGGMGESKKCHTMPRTWDSVLSVVCPLMLCNGEARCERYAGLQGGNTQDIKDIKS